MKITKWLIKEFESTQAKYGTKVALENVLWLVAAGIMNDIGVQKIHTTYKLRGRGFSPGSKKK